MVLQRYVISSQNLKDFPDKNKFQYHKPLTLINTNDIQPKETTQANC